VYLLQLDRIGPGFSISVTRNRNPEMDISKPRKR
jgi:hypothetical protein